MRIRVYPYKQGSKSAAALAMSLKGKVLRLENSTYRPKEGDVVINWGSSGIPSFSPARVLNDDTRKAQNKLLAFHTLKGVVPIPDFWETPEDIPEGTQVCARTVLTGHSGEGLIIASSDYPPAPLYTRYVKKKEEYRVHVFGERVVFIQRKARKLAVSDEDVDWQVRNLSGGFVFVEAPEGSVPQSIIDDSLLSIKTLGLDFGAVDVVWNEAGQKHYVLEVNTAPGLEERTAEKYSLVIKEELCS